VNEALREGGRHAGGPRARRMLRALVITEIAFALVLLAGAGLLIRSFMRLQDVNPGFRAEGLLTARVQLPGVRYVDARRRAAFFTETLTHISSAPGIQSAAGVSFLPMAGAGIATGFYRGDQPEPAAGEAPVTDVRPVTPHFFRTMGIPQLAGRDIAPSDRADSKRVAVISETLARRHFPGENPIGRQINVAIGPPGGGPWEIIGVVGDIKMTSLEGDIRPAVYLPHTQLPIGLMTLLVRTERDPLSLVGTIRQAVLSIDPELPLADVLTMDQVVAGTLARPRTVAVLLSAFAVIALVLAGIGIYGVMAYSVAQRTPEMGVRFALGASPGTLVRTVVREALALVAIGLGIGLAGALAVTRALESQLFDVSATDPVAYAGVTCMLGATALLASLVPAWRAASVDPLTALRTE
jgi:putative ABC transport system permease protein